MPDEHSRRRELEGVEHLLQSQVNDQLQLLQSRINAVTETARAQKEQAERVAATLATQVEATRSQLAAELTSTASAMASATDKVAVSLEKRILESNAQSEMRLEGMRRESILAKDATQTALEKSLETQQSITSRIDADVRHISERLDSHPTARDVSQTIDSYQKSHAEMHHIVDQALMTIEPHSAHEIWRTAHLVEHNNLHNDINSTHSDDQHSLKLAMEAHERLHQVTTENRRDSDERNREADKLADSKMDVRLGEIVTLRAQIDRSVTRDQLDDTKKALGDRSDSTQATSLARMEGLNTSINSQFDRINLLVSDLQSSRANQQGRSTAMMAAWSIGAVILSLTISIILHFMH